MKLDDSIRQLGRPGIAIKKSPAKLEDNMDLPKMLLLIPNHATTLETRSLIFDWLVNTNKGSFPPVMIGANC